MAFRDAGLSGGLLGRRVSQRRHLTRKYSASRPQETREANAGSVAGWRRDRVAAVEIGSE